MFKDFYLNILLLCVKMYFIPFLCSMLFACLVFIFKFIVLFHDPNSYLLKLIAQHYSWGALDAAWTLHSSNGLQNEHIGIWPYIWFDHSGSFFFLFFFLIDYCLFEQEIKNKIVINSVIFAFFSLSQLNSFVFLVLLYLIF